MKLDLRRVLASGVGMGLLAGAAWLGTRWIADADQGGEFRLVRPPGASPIHDPADASQTRWSAQVQPPAIRERVEVKVDGATVSSGRDPNVDLDDLSPGVHLIETEIVRRGQRRERIVDYVVVGPFAERWRDDPGCGLSVAISEDALERMLLPELEREMLAGLRESPYLGAQTEFDDFELTLANHTVHIKVAIEGINRVEVEAWLVVERAGDRSLDVRLAYLGETKFTGQTRDRAVGAGAAVGGVVGPAGAFAGTYLVTRFLDRKSREVIRDEVKAGLEQVKTVELFPRAVDLLPGRPASRVHLAFCDAPEVVPHAVTAMIAVRPVAPEEIDGSPTTGASRTPHATPGPVQLGVSLPRPTLGEDDDVAVGVSLDALNALLDAWTAQGLLSELLAETSMVQSANAQLAEWTTVQISTVGLGLPPTLAMAGSEPEPADDDAAWPIAMAGVELTLEGSTSSTGSLMLAGRGAVRPHWDEQAGRLILAGGLEDLVIGCRESNADGEILRPCFAALLELGDFVPKLDAQLRPDQRHLPALDLRALVEARSDGRFSLERFELRRDPAHPGVVTLVAGL